METPLPAATAAATEKDDPTLWRVDDDLRALLEPILRVDKPRKKLGRLSRDDRAIFDGLIWLARTLGLMVPAAAGVRPQVDRPRAVHGMDGERGAGTGLGGAAARIRRGDRLGLVVAGRRRVHRQSPVRPKRGAGEARATGRNPTDRGKPGTKRHLLTEAKGIPAAMVITGAHWHDMTQLAALLDGTVVDPTPSAPPHLALDRGYDYQACRDEALVRGYTAHIPPKNSAERPPPPGHPDRHPPRRWVVEVAHSWFNRFRRLLTRTEKQARHYLDFVHLAATLIISRKVRHARSLSG